MKPSINGRRIMTSLVAQSRGGQPARPKVPERATSASNPFIKHLACLRTKAKDRKEHGLGLLPGKALAEEVSMCLGQPIRARAALIAEGGEVPAFVEAEEVCRAGRPALERACGVESVLGDLDMALEVPLPRLREGIPEASPPRVLCCEGVQDPGNLGTLLRTASAMGWGGAILLDGCADPWNDKCLRASRAAAFKGQLELSSLSTRDFLARLEASPLPLLAADHRGEGLPSPRARNDPVCLALGAEGGGLSHPLCRAADHFVSVPCPAGRDPAPLNVSVAGGILLHRLSPAGPASAE